MNPLAAYQEQKTGGWTRIDLLLALYDGAIERMEKGVEALKQGERVTASRLLQRSQLIVGELSAGLDFRYGEVPRNLLRLYEFVVHSLVQGTVEDVEGALKVMRNLREGFQGVRDHEVQLERSGQIPPVTATTRGLEAEV